MPDGLLSPDEGASGLPQNQRPTLRTQSIQTDSLAAQGMKSRSIDVKLIFMRIFQHDCLLRKINFSVSDVRTV